MHARASRGVLHLQRLLPSSSLDQEVGDALGRALARTGSRDWRDRSDALRSVAAQAGRLGDLPEAQLVAVLDFLGQHLSDGNLKVQMQDLEVGAQLPGICCFQVECSVASADPHGSAYLHCSGCSKPAAGPSCMIAVMLLACLEPALPGPVDVRPARELPA